MRLELGAVIATAISVSVGLYSVVAAQETSSTRQEIAKMPVPRSAALKAASQGDPDVFPEHLRQFDMICDTHSVVSGDWDPDDHPASPVLTDDPSDFSWRENVDLDRMLSCDIEPCEDYGSRIASADADWIRFEAVEDGMRVRRRDGAYSLRTEARGRIVTTTGHCRPAPYTPFEARLGHRPSPRDFPEGPPVDPARELPRLPGSGKPAPPARFDLVCDVRQDTVNDRWHAWDMGLHREPIVEFQERHIVDLTTLRYCEVHSCFGTGPARIARFDQDVIVLDDGSWSRTSVGDDWRHAIIDRYGPTYDMRITGEEGLFVRQSGICRYEPFSGFPTID